MAQVGWVLLDPHGGRHRIGLYHSDQTGHVLIHCNMRIIQIDFSVKESRSYSFFVEDEFCEVRIFKEKEGFTYEFYVNKKVDTPLNRERKRIFKSDRRKIILSVLGFLLVAAGGIGGFIHYGNVQKRLRLASEGIAHRVDDSNNKQLFSLGKDAEAVFYIARQSSGRKAYFRFPISDRSFVSGELPVPDTGQILLPTGFPLHDGDAFHVVYLPSDPQVFYLRLLHPLDNTLIRYLRSAVRTENAAHPDRSLEQNRCVVETTWQQYGNACLADFIYQSSDAETHPLHNRDTYRRLLRDEDLQKALERFCANK